MPGQGAAAAAYVCGTFDTKAAELHYLADLLRAAGLRTCDGRPRHAGADGGGADVAAAEVAAAHPEGVQAVLGRDDRGAAVSAMTVAFERWLAGRDDVGGIIGAGGSGNTALVAPGDARAAGGRAQGPGLDRGVRQRRALCRPGRHHDAARGHRRAGPEPDLAPGAGQRRARAGRA